MVDLKSVLVAQKYLNLNVNFRTMNINHFKQVYQKPTHPIHTKTRILFFQNNCELPTKTKQFFSEQLRTRLNLRVDNIEKLTAEELRAQVDSAVGSIVNPLKMKSQLVSFLCWLS